ncbi:hypothetical protein EYC80_004202 [Monilinia laxa]|uniref:Uncharacterized protein n=1 Tax=Monilinia laxa TaxID=61186 RepID=A0A5N6KP26_MONLA|nr:hypothetical protein EYC80_004202 [Monilinia laxa]
MCGPDPSRLSTQTNLRVPLPIPKTLSHKYLAKKQPTSRTLPFSLHKSHFIRAFYRSYTLIFITQKDNCG